MDILRVRRLAGVGFLFLGAVMLVVAPFLSFVAAEVPSKTSETPLAMRINGWGMDSGFGDTNASARP